MNPHRDRQRPSLGRETPRPPGVAIELVSARYVGRLYMAMISLRQQIRRELGLTQTEATVVEFLFMRNPMPGRASEIAEFGGISRSAVTKLIDKLEAAGRVRRTASAEDLRASDVTMTASFLRELEEIDARLINAMMPMLHRLDGREVRPLLAFLKDLTECATGLARDWDLGDR
jgi:DNA-binding MarR family transcriptional regulator